MQKNLLLVLILIHSFILKSQNYSDTVYVNHYTINVNEINFLSHTISVKCMLNITSMVDDLSIIKLDLANTLTVDSISNNNIHLQYTHLNSKVTISLSNILHAGDTITINVVYHGIPELDPSWGGFYFSGEYAYNIGVAMTRVPHNYGRCWFPCLDVFTNKSTYTFNIKTDESQKAICGGLLTNVTITSDGKKIWRWELQQPIPTYLASVAVGNYLCYEDTIHSLAKIIPLQIFTYPSVYQNIQGSFNNLKAVFHNYERLFGEYKFDRVGYAGVAFNGGAMEHATNIGYPNYAINGNLNYQTLWAHELLHSWFGNLFTCSTAEEMWLNEGFARYGEILSEEYLYPDVNPATNVSKIAFRELHRSVLKSAANRDGGYYALNHIPQNITYGATTYDKGALIVHTLRNYLGDSLFFNAMKYVFQQYSFANITANQLFNAIGQFCMIDMNDFNNAWCEQPGFLHFSIDSIKSALIPNYYAVHLKQKLFNANYFGNNNKMEITFFTSLGEKYTAKNVSFSGETGVAITYIPFFPDFGIIDLNEKIADAIIDYNIKIVAAGNLNCSDANFMTVADNVIDTVNLYVAHNLVVPDTLKFTNEDIYKLSDSHYWRIEYLNDKRFTGYFQFRYTGASQSQIDYSLLHGYTVRNLKLLYRRDASEDWQVIPCITTGGNSGYLKTDFILPGEYVLAVGNENLSVNNKNKTIVFYPNPANEILNFNTSLKILNYATIKILDMSGRIVLTKIVQETDSYIYIKELPKGSYFIIISDEKRQVVGKFIKQ